MAFFQSPLLSSRPPFGSLRVRSPSAWCLATKALAPAARALSMVCWIVVQAEDDDGRVSVSER